MNYFNNIDELVPWPDSSYNILRKGYSGNKEYVYYEGKPPGPNVPKYVAYRGSGVNSSFAKIPIISIPNTENTRDIRNKLLLLESLKVDFHRFSMIFIDFHRFSLIFIYFL